MTTARCHRVLRALGIALLAVGVASGPPAAGLAADAADGFVLAADTAKKPAAKDKAKAPARPGAAKAAQSRPPAGQQQAATPAPAPGSTVMERAQMLFAKTGRYSGKIDGQVSPEMARALLAYQAEQKLPQTGRLDAATIGRMGIAKP